MFTHKLIHGTVQINELVKKPESFQISLGGTHYSSLNVMLIILL